MPAPWEMDWSAPKQSAPSGSMPWEKDWGSQAKQPEVDFLHPVKPAAGSGWAGVGKRLLQYPGMFLGQINDAGETLGKVSRGELDAASPEAAGAAAQIVPLLSGVSPATGTGAAIAKRAGLGKVAQPGDVNPAFVGPTAGMEAAQTASDLGAPLPAGVVSNTPGVQAATQASRRLPLVGQAIEDRVGNTITSSGNRVNNIAEELGGGTVPDRPSAGDATRQSLQQVIVDNNDKMSDLYADLRQNHIEAHKFGSPQNTKAVLDDIIAKRKSARWANPEAGLADIQNIIHGGKGGTYGGGISFDGLQRARSDVGSQLTTAKYIPNPGFNVGDMKRIYGAMSQDMNNMVRRHVRAGSTPNDASAALRAANSNAQELIERNGRLQALIGRDRSGENIVGGIINATKNKTGNARVLGELRSQMPADDFNKIVSIGLHELGHNPTTGQFSLNKFASGWNNMNPVVKSILIQDPAHRKSLDDISGLGGFLKDADKYVNHSGTGGANAVSALIGAVAGGHIPEAIAGLTVGWGLGKILARPASASALRKWMTIARDRETGRYGPVTSAKASAAMSIATRNLLNNLPEPAQADSSATQQPRTVVTVHPLPRPRPKQQNRAPSGGAYPPQLQP